MGLFNQMKIATKGSILMAQAKQNEKTLKRIEEENKIKAEKYDKEGIPYCPKCCAINLKTNKKKYNVGSSGGKPVLLDRDGNVIGALTCRPVEIVCTCCGYKWKPVKE